jgi:hypothetical protein
LSQLLKVHEQRLGLDHVQLQAAAWNLYWLQLEHASFFQHVFGQFCDPDFRADNS